MSDTSAESPSMKSILLLLSFFISLALGGCRSKEQETALVNDYVKKTFTATSYNYTPHGLFGIRFKVASVPFRIDETAGGGTVFPATADTVALDDGRLINFSAGNCCFTWDRPLAKPVLIRVVWSVVYDLDLFNGESSKNYDDRTSKISQPGSRWCEALVEIPAYAGTQRPDTVFFHFLPDGSVQAELGTAIQPLSADAVRQHSTTLARPQYCKQEIENPWRGVPRQPHRE